MIRRSGSIFCYAALNCGWTMTTDQLAIGDAVEVLDEGLAMLRRAAPGMPPNHHGRVQEIDGDTIMVEFPIDGSYEGHSQVAPYRRSEVKRRAV